MQRSFAPALLLTLPALLTGCAMQSPAAPETQAIPALQGHVHGGNQPVVGATIQIYAAGLGGYSSAAHPLISKSVLTDSNGDFTIDSDYTCPSDPTLSTQVYITATGGNPGLAPGTDNSALALMTALGTCANLSTGTSINVNELTTVAAVWSLAQFMSGYTIVGATPTNATGLRNAFFTSLGVDGGIAPLSIAVGANGNLWMTLSNGSVAEFTPPNTPVFAPHRISRPYYGVCT